MKSYQWVRKQKIRVQKKYIRVFGRYLSPKDFREWNKRRKMIKTFNEYLGESEDKK